MDTKIRLENALKDAMRAHDETTKRTLRMALSAIRFAEIEKGESLDENAVQAILQKEIKAHQESVEEAQRAGRSDLSAAAQAEIDVLKLYLPTQLSAQELEDIVRQVIAETGAASIKEMGQVMKALMPRLQGRATGDQANQMVRKLLS